MAKQVVEIAAAVQPVAQLKASVRRNFAMRHLTAAEYFAGELSRHEAEHLGKGWGPHVEFCGWHASAAIILSFSAIEAAIDEAEDDLLLPAELTDALDRASTLDHAQALLAHQGAATLDKGAEPFQSADLLRALRNALVHPKAEWVDATDRNSQLSRRIVGAHLQLSPFHPDPIEAFPLGFISASIANWAPVSARHFIRELRSRLGLLPGA